MKSPFLLMLLFVLPFFMSAQHSTMFLEDVFNQRWIKEQGITKMTSTRAIKKGDRFKKMSSGDYEFISGIKISEKAKSVDQSKNKITEVVGKGGAMKIQYHLDPKNGLLKVSIMNDMIHKYFFYNDDGSIHYIIFDLVLKKPTPGSHLMTKYQLFEFIRDGEGKLIEKNCYVFNESVKDIRDDLCAVKEKKGRLRSKWSYSYDNLNRLGQLIMVDTMSRGETKTGIYVPYYDVNNFPVELFCYSESLTESNLVGKRFFEYSK